MTMATGETRGAEERIKETFRALLDDSSYERLTVSELCKCSGVSRKTFYRHFKDKEAVLRAIVMDDVALPVKTLMPYVTLGNRDENGKLLLRQIFESIYARKEFYSRAVMQNHINILSDVVRSILTETTLILFRGEEGGYSEKYFYAARYTAGANTAVIKQWIRDGMKIPPEQLTEWVFEFSGSGNAALLNPRM